MVATFLTIMAAIGLATEMARTVQTQYGGPNLPALWWSQLPVTFLPFVFIWVLGGIGYGVLFALRSAGVHRLAKTKPWAEPRK
jgi:hypothetical protein